MIWRCLRMFQPAPSHAKFVVSEIHHVLHPAQTKEEDMKPFKNRRVSTPPYSRRCFCVCLAAFFTLGSFLLAQGTQQLDRNAVLGHLNAAINWYRNASGKVQTVGVPSDMLYQDNEQDLAAQALRLAFESAKAEAQLIAPGNPAASSETDQSPETTETPTREEKLAQFATQVKTRIDQDEVQLAALNKQIDAASGKKKEALTDQREKVQGDLELNKAMQDAVQRMTIFMVNTNEGSTKGLQGNIK